jgi:hypothetical protein|tara:strand:- start:23 stop:256 length:234 start_codon:yes stop_codon:yes gene_type:complete
MEACNSVTTMVKKLPKRRRSACPSSLLTINSVKSLVQKQTQSSVEAYVPWKFLSHRKIIWQNEEMIEAQYAKAYQSD